MRPPTPLCLLGPDTPESLLLAPPSGGSGTLSRVCRICSLSCSVKRCFCLVPGGPWCPSCASTVSL